MNNLKKLIQDFFGITVVVGALTGVKWLFYVLLNFRHIVRDKNLARADAMMGGGPYAVKYAPRVSFQVLGKEAFSGIREMYVRDVYLQHGILSIEDGDFVLDLGANMGNFTNLALAHGKNVRVLAVEPSNASNAEWQRSVSSNPGFEERTQLIRAFIGTMANKQERLLLSEHYSGAAWLSEAELIAAGSVMRVDFLKCDIEGGEYELLRPGSKILGMAHKIAIEVHQFAGDVDAFLRMLAEQGFNLKHIQRDPDGTVTVLGERGKRIPQEKSGL
jgi:FkbM family methyltransferase